jgi:hypothetical protein
MVCLLLHTHIWIYSAIIFHTAFHEVDRTEGPTFDNRRREKEINEGMRGRRKFSRLWKIKPDFKKQSKLKLYRKKLYVIVMTYCGFYDMSHSFVLKLMHIEFKSLTFKKLSRVSLQFDIKHCKSQQSHVKLNLFYLQLKLIKETNLADDRWYHLRIKNLN